MTKSLTLDQIRLVDRVAIEQFGISGLVLMENAGRGAADWIAEHSSNDSHYVILCGTGNNGGDGLVIARHLYARARRVTVLISGNPDKLSHDCDANLSILQKTAIPIHWCNESAHSQIERHDSYADILGDLSSADVVVDALLGTGVKGAPRGSAASLIHSANASHAKKFAIDIPSGMNTETGELGTPTLIAHTTITFVAEKPCFQFSHSKNATGEVVVLPIGIPPEVIDVVLATMTN